jgi:hypothetical protein
MTTRLADIRHTSWGLSYLWEVQFTAPLSFTETVSVASNALGTSDGLYALNTWFPAYNVEEDLAGVDTGTLEFINFTYQFPQKRQVKGCSLDFYDDSYGTLRRWFTNWIEDINGFLPTDLSNLGQLNTGPAIPNKQNNQRFGFSISTQNSHYITPLKDAVKTLNIRKLGYRNSHGALIDDLQATAEVAAGVAFNIPGAADAEVLFTNTGMTVVDEKSYLVYPTGMFKYNGNSESSLQSYHVDFVIAGETPPPLF